MRITLMTVVIAILFLVVGAWVGGKWPQLNVISKL